MSRSIELTARIASHDELVKILKDLNSTVRIKHLPKSDYIEVNVPANELVLPPSFYYTEKNGITNKHNTASGTYISLYVI